MLKPTIIDGIEYKLLEPDKRIANEVVNTYRDGWSRGNDADYFIVEFNDPDSIFKRAIQIQDSLANQELPELLLYLGEDLESGEIATAGAFMFDETNNRVEKCRGVTKMGYTQNGLFGQLSRFMMKDLESMDLVVEADTNTMHKATQGNCEENLDMPIVGFMPLKYKIPSADYWRELSNFDIIYWNGRVSVCHNLSLDTYAGTERCGLSVLDKRVTPLAEIVLGRLGLLESSEIVSLGESISSGKKKTRVTLKNYEDFVYADPSVCGWMKVYTDKVAGLDVKSLVRTANHLHPGIMYVEVDIPATPEMASTQSELLENGFCPVSYMPGFFYLNDERYGRPEGKVRKDGIKFAYFTDKKLIAEYLETMSDRNLRKILIGEAMDIGSYVIDAACMQHDIEMNNHR